MRAGQRGETIKHRDHQVRQAVVNVKTLLAGHHLVPVQEALKRLVVESAFEFRAAEIENALEHGGKGLLHKRALTRTRYSALGKSRAPYRSPPRCAVLAPTATQTVLFFWKAPRRRG